MSGRFSFSSLLSLSTRLSIAMPIWIMRGKWARICKTGQMNAWMKKFITVWHKKLKQQCRFTVSGAHRCSHKLKIQKHLYINTTHWISAGQHNTVAIYKEKGVWGGFGGGGVGCVIQTHTNHHIWHQTIIPILQPQVSKLVFYTQSTGIPTPKQEKTSLTLVRTMRAFLIWMKLPDSKQAMMAWNKRQALKHWTCHGTLLCMHYFVSVVQQLYEQSLHFPSPVFLLKVPVAIFHLLPPFFLSASIDFWQQIWITPRPRRGFTLQVRVKRLWF